MTLSFQMSSSAGLIECMVLLTLLHFFNLTNFFWMMVEGLYLYLLVVETFSRIEVINKFVIYAVIGYGVPAICALSWSTVKIIVSEREGLHEASHQFQYGCPYMQESSVDWIFKGPACLVLIINLIFLFSIMWVLITKLRSANTAETKQYRKASKALLVLIPLFGLTYLIVLYGPNEGMGKKIFDIARAILLSTQGFSVALFYCFLNSEVRKAIKNRINRWRDARNIRCSQIRQSHIGRSRFTKNGKRSQSRAESLRPLTCNIQKRESNVTTTTILTELSSNYASYPGPNGAFQMATNPRAVSPMMKGLDENSV
ncbi:CLUMA_CG019599, isoform A [Clunio marinus]|uniref:CLUMA_CG019599, isoform A n=1 Tax=Clunio marinus TaxID=568069 RepID=A0A1J1J542_9DIPT|nr:CLUMA_CG019599, isoform A [Clunio marinus]